MKKRQLFKEIKPLIIQDNPFKAIGLDWMLIAAGNLKNFNMMTASWGAWGVLWHKNIVFCFVRPTRYTYEFMERQKSFTLSFFPARYRKILNLCGSRSGRDVDKAKLTGLKPFEAAPGVVSFEQARMIFVCKKMYFQDIENKNFLDRSIEGLYPNKDYHRMYVGEITRILQKKRLK